LEPRFKAKYINHCLIIIKLDSDSRFLLLTYLYRTIASYILRCTAYRACMLYCFVHGFKEMGFIVSQI